MKSAIITIAISATIVQALNHIVTLGQGGNLTFGPDEITANVGDTVQFIFFPKNHSVAQASFGSPCVPIGPSGIWSGFHPVSAPVEAFTMVINSTTPLWFYCAQADHCQKGMVMAVNVNASTGKTLAAFKSAAAKASGNGIPNFNPQGGSFESVGGGATPSTSEGEMTIREVRATAMFALGVLVLMIVFSAV